jgi:hypothetical protein
MRRAPSLLARLVTDLDLAGVKQLVQSGDRIAVSPIGRLTPELRERIAPLRAELIELIAVHGPALLPLFRAPDLPLSGRDREALAANAAAIKVSIAGRDRGAA